MKSKSLTLPDLAGIIKRQKWIIVIPMVLFILVAVLLAMLLPRTYRSTSTILIEAQEIPKEYVTSNVTTYADQRLQVLNQRIMSTPRLMEIMKRFNLYREYQQKETIDEIIGRMRKDIKFNTISADVVDPRTGRSGQATIAFSVSYEGKNPGMVQQVANVLASLYLEENIKEREDQSYETSHFMDEEVKNIQARLQKVESGIADYKRKNINTLPELAQVNLQSYDMADRDAIQLKSQLRTLNEKKSSLEQELSTIPVDTSNQLHNNLIELKVRLSELKTRYKDNYPDVVKIRSTIEDLEQQMKSGKFHEKEKPDNPAYLALSSQLAGVKSEIESVQRALQEISGKKDDYRRRIEASPRVEEGYKQMLTERNNLQQKYDELTKKSMDANLAHGLEKGQLGERFSIVDAARMPEKPVSPNVPAIILVGLVLGIGAGAGAASIREVSDPTIRSAEELARISRLPVLSVIPDIITEQDRQKRISRHRIMTVGSLVLLVVGLALVHFAIMDLSVMWAKIIRRFS